jgi:hypothetical protein
MLSSMDHSLFIRSTSRLNLDSVVIPVLCCWSHYRWLSWDIRICERRAIRHVKNSHYHVGLYTFSNVLDVSFHFFPFPSSLLLRQTLSFRSSTSLDVTTLLVLGEAFIYLQRAPEKSWRLLPAWPFCIFIALIRMSSLLYTTWFNQKRVF